MTTITQPLRDEHKELLPQAEILKKAADEMSEELSEGSWQNIREAYEFLVYHLIPHAYAEDQALYPVVQKVMGAPEATATMSRDHVEVARLAAELNNLLPLRPTRLDVSRIHGLRRVLYGLYTLLRLHFAKEEEIYLPLLDARLAPAEASRMFEAMEKAAAEAKAREV